MPLNNGPIPKHYQITEILRRQITSGQLQPGDQIPTEAELCKEFGVSRGTVRRAFMTLAHQGLIHSEQGRGTFVLAPKSPSLFFMLNPFDEEMLRQHRQPSTRVISTAVMPASPEVAQRLELEVDEPVIKIIRLRLANQRPLIHESRFLAKRLCPDLLDQDLETQSIHSLLINKFHIPLTKINLAIEARPLPAREAHLMEVTGGAEAFFIDRLTYTIGESGQQQPAVWYQAYYREHVYRFQAEFEG